MFKELGINLGTTIVILITLYFVIKLSVKNGIKQAYRDITGDETEDRKELKTLIRMCVDAQIKKKQIHENNNLKYNNKFF